jgi:hypothetical protein
MTCAERQSLQETKKLAAESISNGVLSMDLSGPHPVSVDGHRYMLVTALRLANGTVVPFIRTLPSKESSTVLSALLQVMAQISSLTGGVATYFRVHSDCGGEFIARKWSTRFTALGCGKRPLQRILQSQMGLQKGWCRQSKMMQLVSFARLLACHILDICSPACSVCCPTESACIANPCNCAQTRTKGPCEKSESGGVLQQAG